MLNIGGAELMIILLVALVVLGPARLPEVARQVGQTVSTLRSLATGFQAELEAAAKPDDPTTDSSMTLAGPTSQADAIAATQTDPAAIAAAARDVTFDEADDKPDGKSPGGPTDLSAERDAPHAGTASGDAAGSDADGSDQRSAEEEE